MLIFIDYIILIFIFVLVVSVLCGFMSLCESNVTAVVQISSGPSLFCFGLLTPITDGLKLFFNYMLIIMSFDTIAFVITCFVMLYFMFLFWFLFPIGYIIHIENIFSVLIFIVFHGIMTIGSILIMGGYIFNTCFVYIATIRIIIFSMVNEVLMTLLLILFAMIDFYAFFSFNNLSITQVYIHNIFIVGIYFLFIVLFISALDGLRLPFDYAECESEIVTGFVTEFSGAFFVIFSLYEINHTLLSSLVNIILLFGGFYLTLNLLIFILVFILLPNSILCRISMTNAFYLSLFYVYMLLCMYIVWILITRYWILLL